MVSLRSRLVLGLLVVAAIGLGVAQWLTYTEVESYLLDRVDEQLLAARAPAGLRFAGAGTPPPGEQGGPEPQVLTQRDIDRFANRNQPLRAIVPPGTYAAFVNAGGVTVGETLFEFSDPEQRPRLDAVALAKVETDGPFTAEALSGGHYRVRVDRLNDGAALVVALPMTEYDHTLAQLRNAGFAISGAVLLLAAIVAFVVVRVGLRPLDRIRQTASEIAAGDLSRRVSPANERTEIGRLGLALNGMLSDLDASFAERKLTEERLRRFVADASHELRTPLTSIRGYVELYGRGAKDIPADRDRVIARIEEQSTRMGSLVEDLLSLSRLDQAQPLRVESVDLTAIVNEVVEDARARAGGHHVSWRPQGATIMEGDSGQLYQLVTNLVQNAVTHTPPGSSVSVDLEPHATELRLTVRDDGPGIPVNSLGRVFEPFYRADAGRTRKAGGAGLGLAIVAAVARAHSGSAEALCPEKGGAAFEIRLPLRQPQGDLPVAGVPGEA